MEMIHASDNEQEPMEEPTCDNVQKPKLLYTVKQKNRIVADIKNHFIADVHLLQCAENKYVSTDGWKTVIYSVTHTASEAPRREQVGPSRMEQA